MLCVSALSFSLYALKAKNSAHITQINSEMNSPNKSYSKIYFFCH